jgi:hypothetical protein
MRSTYPHPWKRKVVGKVCCKRAILVKTFLQRDCAKLWHSRVFYIKGEDIHAEVKITRNAFAPSNST